MQFSTTSVVVSTITLGFTGLTNAVCSGNTVAVGTAQVLSSGATQWITYDTSCNVKDTYSQDSAVSVCDSTLFYCAFGTTDIDQYDDPTTGWAYSCSNDATVEACGSDTIISCCYPFWGQESDPNPQES